MAVRSGAGTGVIVALVVFIISTVALLIISIAFYSGRAEALAEKQSANDELATFIRAGERNQDVYQRYITAADMANQSVAQHMHGRIGEVMQYLDGDSTATLDRVRSRFARFGVPEDGVVGGRLQDMDRDLRDKRADLDRLNGRLDELTADNQHLASELDRIRTAHRDELQSVQDQIAGYRRAADEYREELNQTKAAMDSTVDRLRDRYEDQIRELQDENDEMHRERVVLMDRVSDLQERISAERIRAQDPATLVDGRIIDTGSGDTVYINRGSRHQIVLGLQFEVYDDAAAIRVDDRTGRLPRGKASIQVVRVDESTSTARITRSVPGRPVVRDDVIANAVYDPDYQFKFLVHGYFDLDGDGRATESERQYIERMIEQWGGIVVRGDELPGDLDFLVLGRPPEVPPHPGDGATDRQFSDYVRAREREERYNNLFRQARDAQIPVLNHNRFLILIGHTQR